LIRREAPEDKHKCEDKYEDRLTSQSNMECNATSGPMNELYEGCKECEGTSSLHRTCLMKR
jgi:hypothetical protein